MRGLGEANIGKIERGERRAAPHELRAIAQATDVPYAFFTVDFGSPETPEATQRVEAEIEEVRAELQSMRESHFERVERLEVEVTSLRATVTSGDEELADDLAARLTAVYGEHTGTTETADSPAALDPPEDPMPAPTDDHPVRTAPAGAPR